MEFNITFCEDKPFYTQFGEIYNISDGGYESGYESGYKDGQNSAPDFLAMRLDGTLSEYVSDKVNAINAYAFYRYSNLKSIFLPNCVTIGTYAFQMCTGLEIVNFPRVITCGETTSYAFSGCQKLKKADFGNLEILGTYAFQNCTIFDTLIIRSSKVCALKGMSAINTTAIYTGNGYVYVPSTLVSAYKNAYNWSTISDRIRAIEDWPEICAPEENQMNDNDKTYSGLLTED